MEKIKVKIEKLKEEFKSREQKAKKVDDETFNYSLNNIQLREYQKDGIKWLIERNSINIGCILADDMGLGKTAQTIGLLVKVLETNSDSKILVLAPLSVVHNWQQEIEKFTQNIDHLLYIGSKEERTIMHKRITKKRFQILLTTYDLALKDDFLLKDIEWSVLIVDEGHRLKNSNSQLCKCLSEFDIEQRVLLTGTPIQNNLKELYSLLCFIQPNLFKLRYIEEFCDLYNTSDEKLLNELTSILQPFVLRRVKSQVNINLPTRYECILYHNLTDLQKKLYKAILTKNIDVFTSSSNKKVRLVSVLMNLRKICLHPYLMPNIEPEPFELGDHLINTSGKFSLLDKLLDYLYKNKHKVLLFSQFTSVLDIVQDYLTYRDYDYERLDGCVRGEERNIAIKNFNSKQDIFIFLLSTKAGGVGLNLVSADTCIFMDNDFNPHNDLQAAARIHRIGQQRPTMIIRLICQSTVEEIIYKRAEIKLKLANDIIESGQLANNLDLVKSTAANANKELFEILKFGLSDLFDNLKDVDNENFDFNKLLAPTSDEGVWLIDEKLKEKKKIEDKTNAKTSTAAAKETETEEDGEPKTIYEFEGKDYSKEVSNEEDDKKLKELIELTNKAGIEESEETNGNKRKLAIPAVRDENYKLKLEEEKLAKKQKLEEKQKQKAEALKQKWKEVNYKSLKLEYEDNIDEKINDIIESEADEDINDIDTKYLNYVKGDVTKLEYAKKTSAILIFCADNSGQWGRGGLFDALVKRSDDLPAFYKQAHEMSDLNVGDVHFIKINNSEYSKKYDSDRNLNDYLALIIAQKRDKSGYLSELNLKAVESAFKQIFIKAKEIKNATIHMPRIGHNTPNFNWYAIERLIKKYFSNLKIPTYIYYYKRRTNNQQQARQDIDDDNERKKGSDEDEKKHRKSGIDSDEDSIDDSTLPNIFKKFNFHFYNLDTTVDCVIEFNQLKRHIVAYNGNISDNLDDEITHIVINNYSDDNLKSLKEDIKNLDIKKLIVVKYDWLEMCLLKKKLINIDKFIIEF